MILHATPATADDADGPPSGDDPNYNPNGDSGDDPDDDPDPAGGAVVGEPVGVFRRVRYCGVHLVSAAGLREEVPTDVLSDPLEAGDIARGLAALYRHRRPPKLFRRRGLAVDWVEVVAADAGVSSDPVAEDVILRFVVTAAPARAAA